MSDLKESLKQSHKNRQDMIKHFGFIPLSILKISRGQLSKNMFNYQNEIRGRNVNAKSIIAIENIKKEETKKKAKERLKYKITGGGSTLDQKINGSRVGASIMPAELVEFFIKYYAKKGDIYLDPFMGQGIRMQVAKLMGLHYYGYDISEEFFSYIKSVKEKIADGKTKIEIFCADSKYPEEIPDNIGDFCFTSPPYWDIEFYGEEKEQLGYKHTYKEFLDCMTEVAKNWLPKFKKGAFCIINVNDFRKKGKFYAYHSDTISLFQKVGYIMTDIWIIEGLVGGLPKVFGVSHNLRRVAPKLHEYALVFRKR